MHCFRKAHKLLNKAFQNLACFWHKDNWPVSSLAPLYSLSENQNNFCLFFDPLALDPDSWFFKDHNQHKNFSLQTWAFLSQSSVSSHDFFLRFGSSLLPLNLQKRFLFLIQITLFFLDKLDGHFCLYILHLPFQEGSRTAFVT